MLPRLPVDSIRLPGVGPSLPDLLFHRRSTAKGQSSNLARSLPSTTGEVSQSFWLTPGSLHRRSWSPAADWKRIPKLCSVWTGNGNGYAPHQYLFIGRGSRFVRQWIGDCVYPSGVERAAEWTLSAEDDGYCARASWRWNDLRMWSVWLVFASSGFMKQQYSIDKNIYV